LLIIYYFLTKYFTAYPRVAGSFKQSLWQFRNGYIVINKKLRDDIHNDTREERDKGEA